MNPQALVGERYLVVELLGVDDARAPLILVATNAFFSFL